MRYIWAVLFLFIWGCTVFVVTTVLWDQIDKKAGFYAQEQIEEQQ